MASSARIDDLRKKFEENPRRYFAPLANEYRKAGEIEQAITICREYLPQQPGHMSGHIVFGQALFEARQFDEAKGVFETALSLDPENLIALRHLGDIALLVGDNAAARGWYGRVLEADPRNEEIQSQLALLDKADAGAAGAAPAAELAQSAPTPLSTTVVEQRAIPKPTSPSPSAPTVVMSAVPRPGAKAAADASLDRPLETVTPESPTRDVPLETMVPAAAAQAPTAEVPALDIADIGLEPTAMAAADVVPSHESLAVESHMASGDAPAMDGFSLDGLETTSLAAPAPAPQSSPAPATVPDLDFGDAAATPPQPAPAPPSEAGIDLDFGTPAPATPTVNPSAPANQAVPVAPTAEIDLDFGTTAASEAAMPGEPAATVDLDFAAPAMSTPAAGPGAEPAAQPPAATQDLPLLDIEVPTPAVVPEAVPRAAEMPAESAAPTAIPAAAAEPFVTETMAELYLQQGHRDKALEVFRAVLAQRPGDASLRQRIAALESPPRPTGDTGPSIREVLERIAQRRPGHRAPANGGTPDTSSQMDALALLFAGLEPGAGDESAAVALAMAFSSSNGNGNATAVAEGPPALTGEPAHLASGELSLDTVFAGTEGGAEAPASNFALNQYFSARATGEHATTSDAKGGAEHRRGDESAEEVAKFTQWLEGLKRR